ncbi:hypothetical protein D3C86_2175030 [compost metagenome]
MFCSRMPSATKAAIAKAPFSEKWVLSVVPSGRPAYSPGAVHMNKALEGSSPTCSNSALLLAARLM